MEKQSSEKRFALLIDADNVSAKYIKPILDELSKYGTITIKRIFGDWTNTLHGKWKDTLLENSITPIQQFSYTQGKNATDSAMIIDAMDILYTDSVDGFCIVSSDSDFTRLASRLRESGLTVIGMGEKKTPVPFRKACDIFTTLELLLPSNRKGRMKADGAVGEQAGGEGPTIDDVEQAVVDIITENLNNGKSTGLGEVGSRMLKRYPDFDVRSYGTNLLSKLIDVFKTVRITKDGSSVTVVLTELGEQRARGHVEPKADEAQVGKVAPASQPKGEVKGGSPKPAQGKRARTPLDAVADRKPELPQTALAKGALPEGGQEPSQAAESEGAPDAFEAPATAHRQPRRRHGKAAPIAVEQPAAPAEPAPAAEPSASGTAQPEVEKDDRDRRPGRSVRKARGQAKDAASEPAAAAEQDAVDKPEQPKRRGRKPKAAVELEGAPAEKAQPAQEPQAGQSPSEQPKRRGRKPKPAPTVTPAEFVLEAVRSAGDSGIILERLGQQVRREFKDFKVRDLGFTQFRQFVASIEGIAVEREDKSFVAKPLSDRG